MRRIIFVSAIIYIVFGIATKTNAQTSNDTIYGDRMTGEGYWIDTDGDGEVDTAFTYSGTFNIKIKENGSMVNKVFVLTFTPADAGPVACDPMVWFEDGYAPDTIFINTKTDTTIYLTSKSDELDTYKWTALNKNHQSRISNPESMNTSITVPVKDTAVYVISTTKISSEEYEMVFNGGFDYGNIGFKSDFIYKEKGDGTNADEFGWGRYAIGVNNTNDSKYYCPGSFHNGAWSHYPATGSPFLFADGQQKTGGQAFYTTTFTVEPNQDYIFQAKFANLNSGGTYTNPGTDYAVFKFFVNDIAVSDYDTLKQTWGVWQTLYTIFNTGDDTLATVTVKNYGVSQDGNDFCLDDVSFLKYCQTSDTIVVINDFTIRKKIEIEICDNETYTFNGKILSEDGYYVDTLKTSDNIDSIVTLVLKVNPTEKNYLDTAICEGNSVEFNGQMYYQSGDYKAELSTVAGGCDSVVYLHLQVNEKTYSTTELTIKSWEDYYFGDSLIRDEGTYHRVLVNENGCDSIATLILHYEDKVYKEEIICEGEEYVLGGIVLTQTGVYADTLTAQNGNDSIVMLSLSVYKNYNDTIYAKIGVGQVYDRDGFYATEPGTYVQENKSVNGCDSSVVLILSVDTPVDIFVPNAFTPKDDYNRTFYIYPASEDIVIDYFRIYNRWGTLIFETNDATIGWNGKYKGEFCKEDLYIYTIEYWRKGEKGKRYRKNGQVMLLD